MKRLATIWENKQLSIDTKERIDTKELVTTREGILITLWL